MLRSQFIKFFKAIASLEETWSYWLTGSFHLITYYCQSSKNSGFKCWSRKIHSLILSNSSRSCLTTYIRIYHIFCFYWKGLTLKRKTWELLKIVEDDPLTTFSCLVDWDLRWVWQKPSSDNRNNTLHHSSETRDELGTKYSAFLLVRLNTEKLENY